MENRTKILVWNVCRFDIGKIRVGANPIPNKLNVDQRTWNLSRMLNDSSLWWTIETAKPDIFVVIEVMTTNGPLGTLIEGAGQQGLLSVLRDLRRRDSDWCLIPAPRLNFSATYTEGIGVFYRSSRLNFTGPYVWPANPQQVTIDGLQYSIKRGIPPGHGQLDLYPSPWDNCLPSESNYRAGQCTFFDASGNMIDFPQQEHRKPFLTTFVEKHDYRRTINLASVHLPPPTQLMSAVSGLKKVVEVLPGFDNDQDSPNSVTVVTGDFNLDRNDNNAVQGIAGMFPDPNAAISIYPDDWLFEAGRCSTYKLWGKKATSAKSDDYLGNSLYDNALIRYGGDGTFAPDHRGFVGDIVSGGRDFANTDEAGFPEMPITAQVAHFPLAPGTPAATKGKVWRYPQNYGHIGVTSGIAPYPGLSDHRPFYFEI